MPEPAVDDPPPAWMERGAAEALVRSLFAVAGYRGQLRRMRSGSPDGPVWVVEATNLVTGHHARLRGTEDWLRFRARCREQERTMIVPAGPPRRGRPRKRPAAVAGREEGPMPMRSENGTAIAVEGTPASPAPPPDGARAPAPPDFGSWEALTRQAVERAQREAGALERALERLQAETLRTRTELKASLAARRREAVLLRRALGAATPDERASSGPRGGANSETARAREQREATHGVLLGWANAHGGQLVLREFREASTLYASSIYRALTGTRGLVTSGVMEKVEPGRYRLVAGEGAGAR